MATLYMHLHSDTQPSAMISMHTYFTIVNCSSLTDPNNGNINCSLRDNGAPSYEDTCSFTCNTGYELTGSDTRICQSDGSWSGSDDVCRRGIQLCGGDY